MVVRGSGVQWSTLRRRWAAVAVAVAVVVASLPSCGDDGGGEAAGCVPDHAAATSVPRLWVDATLDAIRRDFPDPAVHARNLWHLSALMWDVHAAYTEGVDPYDLGGGGQAVDQSVDSFADQADAAESIAISYAAHTLLTSRYASAVGGADSLAQFDEVMVSLCLPGGADPGESSPAAIGMRAAMAVIDFGLDDGSLEADGYLDDSYAPVNPPLVVAREDITMVEPDRWQPLELERRVTQNGQLEDGAVQTYIGSHWGWVTSFALPAPDDDGLTLQVDEPPSFDTEREAFVAQAVGVIRYSNLLGDDRGAELLDVGPASRGNSELGESHGDGHDVNPVTGQPYEPNVMRHDDYGRAVAEYWADGPDSETPPGHWNTLAIEVSDRMDVHRWQGAGDQLNRHDWDLRLFFVLNAGMHDSAVAVWGAKRAYDFPRPISMIRYLGHEGLLDEVPDLVEVVTDESIESGRHSSRFEPGTTVVRSWMGPVMDPESQLAGVDWRPVSDWLPYQRPTFVSPAFAAYVSGHSGFSRTAAELLTAATGSEFFPGGMHSHPIAASTFLHEVGPYEDIELQWATYFDAADEAGESRRYGGIHIEADDLAGRAMGAEVARLVWAAAQQVVDPQ